MPELDDYRYRGARFGDRTYTARWGQEYTIGAMLEHAVMHPTRHTFQLEELMAQQGVRRASAK